VATRERRESRRASSGVISKSAERGLKIVAVSASKSVMAKWRRRAKMAFYRNNIWQ
jgi:hypothetical protein